MAVIHSRQQSNKRDPSEIVPPSLRSEGQLRETGISTRIVPGLCLEMAADLALPPPFFSLANWIQVSMQDQQRRWTISLEALRGWEPQVIALPFPALETAADVLQQLADIALIHLAFVR